MREREGERESHVHAMFSPSLSAHLVVAMGTARQRQTLHQAPRGDCGNREHVLGAKNLSRSPGKKKLKTKEKSTRDPEPDGVV